MAKIKYLGYGIAVICLSAVVQAGALTDRALELTPAGADRILEEEPLTIVFRKVSERGVFDGSPDTWNWSINSAGEGELTIDFTANLAKRVLPKTTRQAFKLSAGQMTAIRKVLRQERFAQLKKEYGPWVIHGGWSTLTIIAGEHLNKTVRFGSVWTWASSSEKDKLAQRAAAARVWIKICEAVDPEGKVFRETKNLAKAVRAVKKQ
jgi:hypothetical protein